MKLFHTLYIAAAISGLVTGSAGAEPLTAGDISSYFNEYSTAVGRFTQYSDDGQVNTGTLYIQQPGQMRFEYDAPNQAVVIAGLGALAIFDDRSNSRGEVYPLSETPLQVLLSGNIDFEKQGAVRDIAHGDGVTKLTLADPDNPKHGEISLIFQDKPVTLRQWIVTTDTGQETVVVFDGLQHLNSIPGSYFNYQAERAKREQ